MQMQKRDALIYYQEKKHHKEGVRALIHSDTLHRLEVNDNPSRVARKAFQSLQINQVENDEINQKNIGEAQSLGNEPYKSESVLLSAAAKLCDSVKFRDYEQEKEDKIRGHVDANYDGGIGFFRASDQYDTKKYRMAEETKQKLQSQLQEKKIGRDNDRHWRIVEGINYRKKCEALRDREQRQREAIVRNKQNERCQLQKLIEEERAKKAKNSTFNYNKLSRHNPITNPIEYHIENPYILKSIQEKTWN